jgi:hypothetical protein
MPRVGFERMILVFERAKRVDALDRAVTAIGLSGSYYILFSTYFRYSYTDRKFILTYTGLFFRMAAYARYDIPCFVEWTDCSRKD